MRKFTASDGTQGITLCHVDQNCCLSVTVVKDDPNGDTVRIYDEHGGMLIANPREVAAFIAEAGEALAELGAELPEMTTTAS